MIVLRWITRVFVLVGLASLAAVFLFGAIAATSASQTENEKTAAPTTMTRATMRGLFTAFTSVYSYSLNMDYFSDKQNRETVTAALEALAANTSELRDHGGGLGPSFRYLAECLASDTEEALKRYKEQEYLGSQFMLSKLMENCAACHSRLPAEQNFDVGAEFIKKARLGTLAPVDRVNVQIAARQFDAALATYEELIADTRVPMEGLLLSGVFEGYLKICIGVKNDSERPIRTLNAFVKRGDVPTELNQQAHVWIEDLRTIDISKVPGHELDHARRLIGEDAVLKRPGADRPDLVRMVSANAFLRRHVESAASHPDDAAESYYLLALTESHISRSYWTGEIDFLLELSVRSAPKTDFARKAFALLEERSKTPQPATAYEGQTTPTVNIDELRKLVEG